MAYCQQCGSRIDENDRSGLIDDDHGVRSRLQKVAELILAPTSVGITGGLRFAAAASQ